MITSNVENEQKPTTTKGRNIPIQAAKDTDIVSSKNGCFMLSSSQKKPRLYGLDPNLIAKIPAATGNKIVIMKCVITTFCKHVKKQVL